MTILLVIIHIIVSIFLIGVVLLQRGKGANMGASFGSTSSQTVFGSRGPGNFMSKLTTIAAVIFILTSFSLAFLGSSNKGGSSVIPEQTEAPVLPQPPAPDAKQIPQAAPAVPGAPVKK
ncbi:MAG: preprotein translocase subunit SecG [Nitrospirota bacterium]